MKILFLASSYPVHKMPAKAGCGGGQDDQHFLNIVIPCVHKVLQNEEPFLSNIIVWENLSFELKQQARQEYPQYCKVDVFSFGIAMWEILTGEEPYANMHCGAIIGGIVNNSLRPPIPDRCDPEWKKLMEECWAPDPLVRPSFTEITNRLRVMSMALQTRGQHQTKR